jgi:hypothetical protein
MWELVSSLILVAAFLALGGASIYVVYRLYSGSR